MNHSVRPRPLALLAILASAGERGISREKILGILWADSTPEKGRHALSQTLYSLRRELGADVTISAPELRLDASKITSDAGEFRDAIADRNWSEAARLYEGPFVDGFYMAEAPEFERWSEAERSDLALHGLKAIESVAVELETAGRLQEAAQARRRLTRLDPLSEAYARAYMEVLAAAGDRAGALSHGRSFTELMKRELETEPGDDFNRLVKRLRTRPTATLDSDGAREIDAHSTPAPAMSKAASSANSSGSGRTDHLRSRIVVAAIATVAIGAAAMAVRARTADSAASDQPIIAVGRIRDLVTPDSVRLGGVLGEMLTTSLGRLSPLQVIANSRMLELTPREADTTRTALVDAARRAGATEVIEGELVPLGNGLLRLDIRRVNLADGRIRAGYAITGDDRMILLDSVTSLIGLDLRFSAPVQSLADVSTRSPLAHRYYEDGLRAFYQFDAYAANRLFRAAIREDSTFAMAVYYAWRSAVEIGDSSQSALGKRATALASKASERDRLLILAHVGGAQMEWRSVAAADSLGERYPTDPEALVRSAAVIPDLRKSIEYLNRAIALDSAAGTAPGSICRLCEALGNLANKYVWADSMSMVESTFRRWIRLRPDDATPWGSLSDHLVGAGRMSEAESARRRSESLGGTRQDPAERKLLWALKTDDVEGVMRQCPALLTAADREEFGSYQWYCTIGLRMAGRFNDALALIRDGRVPGTAVVRRGMPRDPVHGPILEWESGRPLASYPRFARLGFYFADSSNVSPGWRARTQAWQMTLAASAAIAGGDTVTAKSLVDSIEAVGSRSIYVRDPKLHHFIRGQLLAARGDQEGAVREYRSAISSPTNGYTRVNYELARSLLALRRPAEAVPVIRAVLHGGLEGSGLYLTRTEAHDVLAHAFEMAGRRDSALVHYAIVEKAWRGADPILQPRYAYARMRVAGNWH